MTNRQRDSEFIHCRSARARPEKLRQPRAHFPGMCPRSFRGVQHPLAAAVCQPKKQGLTDVVAVKNFGRLGEPILLGARDSSPNIARVLPSSRCYVTGLPCTA